MTTQQFILTEKVKQRLQEAEILVPFYNMFADPNAVKISQRDYVTSELIPVTEYTITVNKEAVTNHTAIWKPAYNHFHFEGEKVLNNSILYTLAEKFKSFLFNQ